MKELEQFATSLEEVRRLREEEEQEVLSGRNRRL
jgi:hypothetical protein